MKLNKCMNAIFISWCFYSLSHKLEITFIKLSFFGFNSRPHNTKSNTINSQRLKKFHISLIEFSMIRRYFTDQIKSMENKLSTSIINQPSISNLDLRQYNNQQQ